MRKCTIRLRVQQFLFKLMHSTQMIGEVWFNIQNHEQRGTCSICNTTESMSHIITSCRATPVNLIWDLAKYLWPHDPTKWPQINLGLILGVGCLAIKINKCKSSAQLVEVTWDKVLRKFSDPLYMWIHNREVLVGSIMQCTWPIAGHMQ